MATERHQRFDFATISSKPTKTPQGFLRIDANLTRVGVLLYRDDSVEGGFRRELRHPDDVFNMDSMKTLGLVPVTDLHPMEGLINPGNVTGLRRGVVSEIVKKDASEKFVQASVIVEDADLIKKVEDGLRRELSPGYTARVDEEAGKFLGERYDFRQHEIVYNHMAVGPKGWGRSGSDVALRMDSGLVSHALKRGDAIWGVGTLGNDWERSGGVGVFVRGKLETMSKSTAHLADALGVDRWAVESFLDGHWSAIDNNKKALADPDGSEGHPPDTGLAKRSQFKPVADFIDVPVDTLFDLVPVAERGDGGNHNPNPTRQTRMDAMEEMELNGIKFDVPAALAGAVRAAIEKMKADQEELKKEVDAGHEEEEKLKTDAAKQTARADAAEAETKKVQVKLDEAIKPEAIRAAVKARTDLEASARKVVVVEEGKEASKFDEMSDKDVKIAVVMHSDKDATKEILDAKEDAYLEARFDAVVAIAKATAESVRTDTNDDAVRIAALASQSGGKDLDADKARLDSIAESTKNPEWKKSTTFSKNGGASA